MERTPRNISILNDIHRPAITKLVDEGYFVRGDFTDPDVILVRSADLRNMYVNKNSRLRVVGRVGIGVNNIPVDKLTEVGVPVFNTPGANANAVKELTIAGMIMASRNVYKALKFVDGLEGSDAEIKAMTELSKVAYTGHELSRKTLGVIGLGAIGRKVAKAAGALGMEVIGHDPYLTPETKAMLSKHIHLEENLHDIFGRADIVSFHVPPNTRDILTIDMLNDMKRHMIVLNFSRDEVLDTAVVLEGIAIGRIACYVTDFPNAQLIRHEKVITFPHIGASTVEAKENCAYMIVDQVTDFLENGNIHNSVNFPESAAPQNYKHRLIVANRNIPNMIAQISTTVAGAGLNIENMVNSSRGEIAYTILDVDNVPPDSLCDVLLRLDGVLMVRIIR